MAIDKEKTMPSSLSKSQCASQKNAAVTSKNEWEPVFIQQGSDVTGKVSTVVPDSMGVPYPCCRIDGRFVLRWGYLSFIFRVQSCNDAMGSEHAGHLLNARFLTRGGRF